MNSVTLVAPIVVLLISMDIAFSAISKDNAYDIGDTASNIFIGLSNVVSGIAFSFIGIFLDSFTESYRPLGTFEYSTVTIVFCFIIDDFRSYWAHRFGHTIRWCWADHSVHHSSGVLNLSTGLRLGPTFNLTPLFLTLVPMLFIGFPLAMIVMVHGVNLVYQFLVHTPRINKMPKFYEYIFNTPSHHRVHHSSDTANIDKNFGTVFIIWDRMFHTFKSEGGERDMKFGLTTGPVSGNPIKIMMWEWRKMAGDLARSKHIGSAIKTLLGKP